MGLFDFFQGFFKKKEADYDPTNLSVHDLKLGFMLDYDLKTWEIKEVYEYDWGNGFFTHEYKLDSGEEVQYLHVEQDDDLELTMSKKVKIRSIDEDIPEEIINNQIPPKKLFYKNKKFFRDNETPGYFRNANNNSEDAWLEFISWDYFDENAEEFITIEQWGEREFEASFGRRIKEFEISNILPITK